MQDIENPTPEGHAGELLWRERWPEIHRDLVRYVSHLLAGDIHAAEDVAQETAIRFWQHPEVLDDGRPVTGWLRTVARHIVVDRVRRRRARPAEVVLGPTLDVETGDLPDIDRVDATDSVVAMLAALPPGHRAVVFEVYVRDRPVAEVAADLGIPAGTVKSRCHHAVRRLRAALEGAPAPRCA